MYGLSGDVYADRSHTPPEPDELSFDRIESRLFTGGFF
jgi:hypothetical protein